MNKLNSIEKAYLAGFIDGEGCISITKMKQPGAVSIAYRLTLTITQGDKKFLEQLRNLIGIGSLHQTKKYPHIWIIQLSATSTYDLLTQLLPYLKIKNSQAYIALQLYETTKLVPKGKGKSVPMEVSELREKYYIQMRQEKSNGLLETRGRKRTRHELYDL